MTKIYKSARGKMIDMDRLKLAQENTIAVGNMKVNARGDKVGAGGEVVTGRNQIMDTAYAVQDNFPPYSPNDPVRVKQHQAITEANKAQELQNLVSNSTVATPTPEAVVPAARGNLANSVAKPTAVTQQPAAKTTGPTRI